MDEFTKKLIQKIMVAYTENKIPVHLQSKMRLTYKIRGSNVTLVEERPAFRSDQWIQHDIAQFRLDQGQWKIYWKNSKSKWHYIDDYIADSSFENQLAIVDKDEHGMFWN